jgi:hypothetical protein
MHITLCNVPSKYDTCELFNAVVFYGEKLMSKRMLLGIDLKIIFVPKLEAHYNIVGDCGWEDDNIRPREFKIRLDADMGKRKMLIALAHEMVHIKQYARSEMRDTMRQSCVKWGRETVNTDAIDYWDLPWEIEAHGREAGLYVRFKTKWFKEKKNAKAAYKAQPDCAGSSHTFVLKEGCEESEDL